MKLKVLKPFSDKETGILYKVGEIIEVTDKRGNEILSSRYEVAELVGESYRNFDDTEIVKMPKKRTRKTN